MLYLVTGHPRSGTSMMMAALEAGGIPASYNSVRQDRMEARNTQASGLNPTGLYELTVEEYKDPSFPSQYDETAVKMVWNWLPWLNHHAPGISVIHMLRDPEEVRQSYEAALGTNLKNLPTQYTKFAKAVNACLTKRDDVRSYTEINYRNAISQPLETFDYLADMGWPIDPWKAATIVNPAYYRFRLGELIVEGA